MVLIPGLPDEIVFDCLIRVKYDQFPTITSVCKGWKSEIELPEFHRLRNNGGYGQKLVVMVQARVAPNQGADAAVFKCPETPLYRFTLCEPETGNWEELTPISDFPDGALPMFCQMAAVGTDLVVIGGLEPGTWKTSNAVYVYNFVSATWRRGGDMPGGPRVFFGCASDSKRTVYVAGGHDDNKDALRSAIAYDVEKDEWRPLPDMERERDECKLIFRRGKLHVISGYCTEMQGRYERSVEKFNPSTWRWDCFREDFLPTGVCPRTCVDGGDGSVYMCRDGNLIKRTSGTWQTVAELPAPVRKPASLTACQGKLLLVGCADLGEPHMDYMFHLENYTWSKVDNSEKYSGHVHSSCYLEV